MNPFAFICLAVIGLISIMIYLGTSERTSKNIQLAQEKHYLESMKFDKDFDSFVKNEDLLTVSDEEISNQKKLVGEIEQQRKIADEEVQRTRLEMQETLNKLAKE